MRELEALCATDFEWASHIEGVWGSPVADVPEIHHKVRDEFARRIDGLTARTASPLGLPVVGEAGSGKTHLLAALRRVAYVKGAGFVLVDMTDVNDFWATVQLGFLAALRRPGPSGEPQAVEILEHALQTYISEGSGLVDTKKLSELPADKLATYADIMIKQLTRRFPDAEPHRDAIRALVFYNSSDFELNSVGYSWLQGLGIEPGDRARFRFMHDQVPASQVLRALAWLFSLKGPVVIALDQLDAMLAEHHVAAGPRSDDPLVAGRQQRSLAIIEAIGTGLLALRDLTKRALLVPVCLEASWTILGRHAVAAALDRYNPPLVLHKQDGSELLRKVVAGRLQPAFAHHGITAPHDSWPFATRAFAGLTLTPRELLKRCARHVSACVDAGRILELESFTEPAAAGHIASGAMPDRLIGLDRRYTEVKASVDVESIKGEAHEGELDQLLDLACDLLVSEYALPDGKDALVDRDFERTGKLEPLHARIRLVHHDDGDREEHFSFRVLVHDHPIAFQSRLNAAITAAGIDRELNFRTLRVLRFTPVPTGKKTSDTLAKFEAHGGKLVRPSDDDLRGLRALADLAGETRAEEFDHWQRARRPVSDLSVFADVVAWLRAASSAPAPRPAPPPEAQASQAVDSPPTPPVTRATHAPNPSPHLARHLARRRGMPARPESPMGATPGSIPHAHSPLSAGPSATPRQPAPPSPRMAPSPPPRAAEATRPPAGEPLHGSRTAGSGTLPLGPTVPLGLRRLAGAASGELIALPLEQLKRHTVVLAGAGAGKTVLVRRLTEEAALQGIPSIVIDIANDLATFGEPWPDRPAPFSAEDDAKAAQLFASTETVVWTPGRSSGNPLTLQLLPALSALSDTPDEYREALDLARATLEPWVQASGAAARQRAGVLQSVLDWFARRGLSGLEEFIGVLTELPADAGGGYDKADKHARKMADELRAALHMNPLLRTEGTPLDPAVLFGDHRPCASRTRISVLNLQALPSLDAQQGFVAQLGATLFSWIKANPAPPERALRGLLVIDEAKDLAPSGKRTASGEALIRLANQARKYGLGLVFATQAPKSIDHNIIANCATQFYGRASSPAALDVIRAQLSSRGATGDDAAKLTKGEFYTYSEGFAAPVKIQTRLSLSYHPDHPLDEVKILERARRVRPT